jgi:diketogulonate reductase-like aldo/keto reductase
MVAEENTAMTTTAMTRSPLLTLNNGVQMPALGLGVFQSPPDETADAVESALRHGYRLIDTAAAYFNERQVGEGLRRSGVRRDEVFLETKVWISDYGYDATLHAFDKAAVKLGVDRLDLLLLHQPLSSRFDLMLDAYRALEKLLADGKVRAIGVSNFMPDHLQRLLAKASVVPAVNQIEVHPYFQQRALQRLHAEHGILTQAWSPRRPEDPRADGRGHHAVGNVHLRIRPVAIPRHRACRSPGDGARVRRRRRRNRIRRQDNEGR